MDIAERESRLAALRRIAARRRLDDVAVTDPANVMAFAGVKCDNAILTLDALYTDFRYAPAVRRLAPGLKVRDIGRFRPCGARIGYEGNISHSRFVALSKSARRSRFVDILRDLRMVRAVKAPGEIELLRAAERLDCEIWEEASRGFRAGMTEIDMARAIRALMAERGEGEAFETIVCIGANAAECHHEPDGTVWNGRDPVLVDMGVRLGGVCSDLTRNIVPRRASRLYSQVYRLVREANEAAIAAARPGITGRQLDAIARSVIRKGGFGRCFGHALGHGVGYEVHEAPTASRRGDETLKPGMVLTIEPGIYLEGNLGVRIEDLVLITETGCEVLSSSAK